MSTTGEDNQRGARFLGCRARLGARPEAETWVPPSREEVEAMACLLESPPGGPQPGPGDAAPRPKITIRLEPPAPRGEGPRRRPTAEKMPGANEGGEAALEPAGGGAPQVASPPPARPPLPEGVVEGSVQALVWRCPEDAARVARTMLVEADEPEEGTEPEIPTMQRVAVLFAGLGEAASAEVLKHMSDYEIEEITQAMAGLRNASRDTVNSVLGDFRQRLQAGEWLVQSGVDCARAALERALGPRKAQEILDRVATKISSGFYMLKNVSPDQIAPFISNEHPQTIALILSQLDPAQGGGILAQLPERMQSDVAYRVATMENITPNVIKEIEESLEQSLRDILGGNQDVGGPKVVADMLNLTGSSVEKNVLDQMDGQDPEVAASVRNLMFVFEDIAKLRNPELKVLLQAVDQKDLVIALKTASKSLMDRVLSNVPEEARATITEERETLGPIRLSEVEEVQLRVVQQVRRLEEQGKITIVRGESEDSFV